MTIKSKIYDFDDLESTLEQRKYWKSKVDELANKFKIEKGKLEQIERELVDAEAGLKKEEKRLRDILSDIVQ